MGLEGVIALAQALLRFPSDGAHGLGLSMLALLQRGGEASRLAVLMGRFDQGAAGGFVARLGDAALAAARAGGILAGPTQAADKRPAVRRVFAERAVWLRCFSIEDRPGIISFVAPRQTALSAKTGPHGLLKQALRRWRATR